MRRLLTIVFVVIVAGAGGLFAVGFLVYQLFIVHPITDAPGRPATVPVVPEPMPAPTPESAPATPERMAYEGPRELIIRITDSGVYEPHDVTLYVGDTLTFINEDGDLHWPGANPHPTHSSLPGFSASGGIMRGQWYSYVFMRPGVFAYHEHLLNSSVTIGRITVLSQ